MPDDAPILYDLAGGVATVTINRPDQRNSLNMAALTGLTEAVARVRDDRAARVLVLTGAGELSFCSGADLTTMFAEPLQGGGEPAGGAGAGPGNTAQTGPTGNGVVASHEARGALASLFGNLWSLGKPTIAKVRGYALAGGFGLAMACDIVIASDDAVFGTPEINVGLWPYMITIPLLRSMPPKVALELMMTGRRVGAEEARSIGFVSRVVPITDLDAAVAETAATLATRSPEAMRLGRTSFYRVLGMETGAALDHLQAMLTVTTMTGDAAEGIAAFLEKRPPEWTGPGWAGTGPDTAAGTDGK